MTGFRKDFAFYRSLVRESRVIIRLVLRVLSTQSDSGRQGLGAWGQNNENARNPMREGLRGSSSNERKKRNVDAEEKIFEVKNRFADDSSSVLLCYIGLGK